MAWNVEVSPRAQRQLDQLDKPVARRISKFLYERISNLRDPRLKAVPGRMLWLRVERKDERD